MGLSTSALCQPCPQCSEVAFDKHGTVAARTLFEPYGSECAEEEESTKEESTEQERWVREPSELLIVKADLASHALRSLSQIDYEASWEQLRCEFEVQSGLWARQNGGKAKNQGLQKQLKSKIECGLAMRKGGRNRTAIVALEAALMTDAAAKHVSKRGGAKDTKAMEAQLSKTGLSSHMRACTEEVLAQMCVSQARHELADYMDMASSLDNSRLDKPQSSRLETAKACDLKHRVLKEYIGEIFAADAQLLAEINKMTINGW